MIDRDYTRRIALLCKHEVMCALMYQTGMMLEVIIEKYLKEHTQAYVSKPNLHLEWICSDKKPKRRK